MLTTEIAICAAPVLRSRQGSTNPSLAETIITVVPTVLTKRLPVLSIIPVPAIPVQAAALAAAVLRQEAVAVADVVDAVDN